MIFVEEVLWIAQNAKAKQKIIKSFVLNVEKSSLRMPIFPHREFQLISQNVEEFVVFEDYYDEETASHKISFKYFNTKTGKTKEI